MKNMTGREIKGYELRDLIGRGGFGVVYRAFQHEIEREVAIKIILPQYANRPYFIRNFKFEAQIIARLEHIHIVPLYDYWRDPNGAYIVMRWLRGGSLLQLLKNGPLDIPTTAKMLDQIAAALQTAHLNSVVHQDLKAANILLDEENNAYLTDFGIAKDLEGGDEVDPDDPDNIVRGSPEYMSPEQILNTPIDARTDIYSLGILLYEMLTGTTPFQSEDDQEVLKNQMYDKLPPLQDHNPDLPEPFNIVIQRATDKHPKRRYQSPIEMAQGFRMLVDAVMGQATSTKGTAPPVSTPRSGPKRSTGVLSDQQIQELLDSDKLQNPYKGLEAFQENDAGRFYGRESTINRLLDRLRESDADAHFLTVIGPSGIGKSSVVRAGVIPALRNGAISGSDKWFIADLIPSDQPLARLESAILSVARKPDDQIVQTLQTEDNGLHKVLQRILQPDETLLLIIDQFEELFTLTDDKQRLMFMDLVLGAIRADDSRLRIIITLRADFYDRPLAYAEFGELVRSRTEVVLPMLTQELHDAIVRPAEEAGLILEDGLSDQIIADVSEQPGALPLLQYALSELFDKRVGRKLTRDNYLNSGGVFGALTTRADELFLPMSTTEKQAARQLFLRLVTLGEGTEDTRKRVKRVELLSLYDKETMMTVIERYGKYRLLSFDNDANTRAPTVEIAHEALIRNWDRLRMWLDESRDALRIQRQLAQATAEWINSDQKDSFLALRERLVPFIALRDDTDIALSDDEIRFIKASAAYEGRIKRRNQAFGSVLVLVTILAIAFGIFAAVGQRDAANARDDAIAAGNLAIDQRDESRSREFALNALDNAGPSYDTALLLAAQAVNFVNTFEARDTLFQLLTANPNLKTFLHGHTDFVRGVALHTDRQVLASAGQDNTVRIWDMETNQLITTLDEHTGWVNTVAFSPDGSRLISGSHDDRIIMWDAENYEMIGEPIDLHTDEVWQLAWLPDGDSFVSVSADETVRIWDADTLQQTGDTLSAHTAPVTALAVNGTGTQIASGDEDGIIYLWNVETGERIELIGHSDQVRSLAYDDNGVLLLSGGTDGIIRVWNARAGQLFGEPITGGHTGEIWSVEFVPGTQTAVTAAEDGAIFFWDLNARQSPFSAIANLELSQTERPTVVDFAIDASRGVLVAANQDPRLVIWDLTNTLRLGAVWAENEFPVLVVDHGSNGTRYLLENSVNDEAAPNVLHRLAENDVQRIELDETEPRLVRAAAIGVMNAQIATTGADLRVHDMVTGELLQVLPSVHRNVTSAVQFSNEGDLLVSGDDSGILVVWGRDVNGIWSSLSDVQAHDGRVWDISIHPNGVELATAGEDGLVKRWNVVGDEITAIDDVDIQHDNEILVVQYSHSGNMLASGDRDGVMILTYLEDDREPIIVAEHNNMITDIVFRDDDRMIVSGSRDRSIRLWEFAEANNRALRQLGRPLAIVNAPIVAMDFSTDRRQLIVSYDDGTVVNWDLGLQRWAEIACEIANRDLSSAEIDLYLYGGDVPAVACQR